MTTDTTITMYGTSWCPFCKRSERVFQEMQIPFHYVNIEQDEAAAQFVMSVNDGNQTVPTITFGDGSVLVAPSNQVLKAKINSTASITAH